MMAVATAACSRAAARLPRPRSPWGRIRSRLAGHARQWRSRGDVPATVLGVATPTATWVGATARRSGRAHPGTHRRTVPHRQHHQGLRRGGGPAAGRGGPARAGRPGVPLRSRRCPLARDDPAAAQPHQRHPRLRMSDEFGEELPRTATAGGRRPRCSRWWRTRSRSFLPAPTTRTPTPTTSCSARSSRRSPVQLGPGGPAPHPRPAAPHATPTSPASSRPPAAVAGYFDADNDGDVENVETGGALAGAGDLRGAGGRIVSTRPTCWRSARPCSAALLQRDARGHGGGGAFHPRFTQLRTRPGDRCGPTTGRRSGATVASFPASGPSSGTCRPGTP